jgi:hypothetical protein
MRPIGWWSIQLQVFLYFLPLVHTTHGDANGQRHRRIARVPSDGDLLLVYQIFRSFRRVGLLQEHSIIPSSSFYSRISR